MKRLDEFNENLELWLLSLGFEPYGHEFHMKYKKSKQPYSIEELNKSTKSNNMLLSLWLENNLNNFGVKEIHYRLVNNLNLIVEKIELNNEAYDNLFDLIYKDGVCSPRTIKEITPKV